MRSLPWSREEALDAVKAEIWRYVSAASTREDLLLQAAALLGMSAAEVRSLAQVQFVISDEVGELLEAMPELSRRLTTTTEADREQSADRVRGAPAWGPTIGARAASGNPLMYVTSPARRAYQTPENELLVFLLEAIVRVARHTGWATSKAEVAGRLVRDRHDDAVRWLSARALQEIKPGPITRRTIARVRQGRAASRFAVALAAHSRYKALVDHVDVHAVREAVERHGLVTRSDDILLELLVLFGVERALTAADWDVGNPRLMEGGGSLLAAERGEERLEVYLQRSLPKLSSSMSVYASVQRAHGFARSSQLRPDLLLRHSVGDEQRWVLLEVKGGGGGTVEGYARAALQNLLAYRQDARDLLEGSAEPYGLGVVWGEQLTPVVDGAVALCTPDTIGEAVEALFEARRSTTPG
jgi:hypothetical protein